MTRKVLRGLPTLLVLLLCWAAGMAQESLYTYGGSGQDTLDSIAVSGDGRILMTGFTSSTDGTLASRTKKGRSGWALCVDGEGNVLWSFCSRNTSQDRMLCPAFLEDGSAEVLLVSESKQQAERIVLDREGEVVLRNMVFIAEGNQMLITTDSPKCFGGGFVFSVMDQETFEPTAYFVSRRGRILRTLTGEEYSAVMATGEHHAIEVHDGAFWLCALAEDGADTRLCQVSAIRPGIGMERSYSALLSLPDGGAVGCGWVMEKGRRLGLLSRWDAQGGTVCEWFIPKGTLSQLMQGRDGLIAHCAPVTALDEEQTDAVHSLIVLDDKTIPVRHTELPPLKGWFPGDMAILEDGHIAVLLQEGDAMRVEESRTGLLLIDLGG